MFHAKNYINRPMFHGVIENNTGTVFLRHGVIAVVAVVVVHFVFPVVAVVAVVAGFQWHSL